MFKNLKPIVARLMSHGQQRFKGVQRFVSILLVPEGPSAFNPTCHLLAENTDDRTFD
ncbi:MAG: hypothetical protein AB1733_15740 [Thermodesulfobacteriota bacterium]